MLEKGGGTGPKDTDIKEDEGVPSPPTGRLFLRKKKKKNPIRREFSYLTRRKREEGTVVEDTPLNPRMEKPKKEAGSSRVKRRKNIFFGGKTRAMIDAFDKKRRKKRRQKLRIPSHTGPERKGGKKRFYTWGKGGRGVKKRRGKNQRQ